MAPQELEQGSWLPGSLRGLAPQEPELGRLLPGVTIYHHPQVWCRVDGGVPGDGVVSAVGGEGVVGDALGGGAAGERLAERRGR